MCCGADFAQGSITFREPMISSAVTSAPAGRLSIVVPTYNRAESLRRCLRSLFEALPPPYEVIVVDDASDDGTELMLRTQFSQVRYIRHNKRELPAKSVNDGILAAQGQYVLIVDDDNVVDSRITEAVIHAFQSDRSIAVVGTISYYLHDPDTIMYAAVRLSRLSRRVQFVGQGEKFSGQFVGVSEIELCHNCLAVRKEAAMSVGLIDPNLLPHFNYEIALQTRIRSRGGRIVLNPEAKVWHDVPFDPRSNRTFESTFRLYYSIRSKIVFEKYFDTARGRLTYSLLVPMYLIGYLFRIVETKRDRRARAVFGKVALEAFRDGLMGKYGLKEM